MQAIVMQFIIISLRVQYVNNFLNFFQIILTFHQNANIMNLNILIFYFGIKFFVNKINKKEEKHYGMDITQ